MNTTAIQASQDMASRIPCQLTTRNQNTMITHRIYDTFNRRVISKHKSIKAAVIAAAKFSRAVKRTNGNNHYIPTRIEYFAADVWIGVPIDEVHDAENAAGIR